jgi:hypothetical protein
MPMEFRPAEPARGPSLKPVQRSTKPIDRGPGEAPPPGKAPSARPDFHARAPVSVEAILKRAAEAKCHPLCEVLTSDEFVENELRANRGRFVSMDEAKLGEAESKVDRKIGEAVIRGDVASVNRLERRKAAIDDELLCLAQEKIQRQREEEQKKVREQIAQDHMLDIRAHAVRDQAAASKTQKRREESKVKNTRHSDRVSKKRHAEYAKSLAKKNLQVLHQNARYRGESPTPDTHQVKLDPYSRQYLEEVARQARIVLLARIFAERAQFIGVHRFDAHPLSSMVSQRGILGCG